MWQKRPFNIARCRCAKNKGYPFTVQVAHIAQSTSKNYKSFFQSSVVFYACCNDRTI